MAEDHDLLIQLNTKVNNLCTMIQDQKDNYQRILNKFEKRDDDCDKCRGEIYDNIDKKVSFSLFKWLMGAMGGAFLVAFIFFATSIHNTDTDVATQQVEIENLKSATASSIKNPQVDN
jgi:hypothetical protein